VTGLVDANAPKRDEWLVLVDRLRVVTTRLGRPIDSPGCLSSADHHVALSIGVHSEWDGSEVWTSMRRLRSQTGRAPKTIQASLEHLRELGLLAPLEDLVGKGLPFELTATQTLVDLADELERTQKAKVAEQKRRQRSAPPRPEDSPTFAPSSAEDAGRVRAISTNVRDIEPDVRAIEDQCPRLPVTQPLVTISNPLNPRGENGKSAIKDDLVLARFADGRVGRVARSTLDRTAGLTAI
jgi:hypothetical protein